MVRNDGSNTNEEVFWKYFSASLGCDARQDEPLFKEFYKNEFQSVRKACGFTSTPAMLVKELKSKGFRVVLATNPLFPAIATHSRILWAGMSPDNFDLVTTYENSRYCKPNPDYYRDVLRQLNATAEECIMIGNDVSEDMVAQQLGIKVFLLTDCLINKENKDITLYPHGGFSELFAFINELIRSTLPIPI